jgi:hypothetical protein
MVSKRALTVAACAAGLVSALAAPSVAFAATANYPNTPPPNTGTSVTGTGPAPVVLGETETTPPTTVITTVKTPTVTTPLVVDPTATGKPSLPFTGLDTISLVAVGGALIAGGSAVTIASRKRRTR